MPFYPSLAVPQTSFFKQKNDNEVAPGVGPTPAGQALILDHTPAGYWHANDTGTGLADSSGNARNGTLSGSGYTRQVTALSSYQGTKFTVAGSDYSTVAHNTVFNLSVATGQLWTLVGTFRWDSAGAGYPTFIGKGDLGNSTGWAFNVAATPGNVQFSVNGADATHQLVAGAGWTGTGVWKRCVVTCTDRTVTISVNGSPVGSKTFGADYTVSTTSALMMGRNDFNSTPGYSSVTVSEVGIVQGYAYTSADVAKDWTEASTGTLQGSGGGGGTGGTLTPTAPSGPAAPTGGWATLFAEDFDTLDTSRWDTGYRQGAVITSTTPGWTGPTGLWGTNPGNSDQQWCLPANVGVSGSRAVLQAKQQTVIGSDGRSYGYTSGMLTSYPSAQINWQTVRTVVEARINYAAGQGLAGNFWLLPVNLSWPPEIDVAATVGETAGNTISAARYRDSIGTLQTTTINTGGTSPLTGEHVYTVDLDPAVGITWFIDGAQVGQITDTDAVTRLSATPMYVLFTLAVGGSFPAAAGTPDGTTVWPAQMTVDYLRIWTDPTVVAPSTGGTRIIPTVPTGPAGTFTLVMADAFTGTSIDTTIWGSGETLGGSGYWAPDSTDYASSAYSNDFTGVSTGAAGLTLTAQPLPSNLRGMQLGSTNHMRTCYYHTPGVKSFPHRSSDPGWTAVGAGFTFDPTSNTFVLEAKLKMDPNTATQFPAWWAETMDGSWPPELDFMEMLAGSSDRGKVTTTIHAGSSDSLYRRVYQSPASDPTWSNSFHVYTTQVGPTGFYHYIDGSLVGSNTESSVLTAIHHAYCLLLNLSTVGTPGPAQLQMQCQYVTVWRKSTDSGGLTTSVPLIGAGTVYP